MTKGVKPPGHCGYVFHVKGRGPVTCELKTGHVALYHEHDFGHWKARRWPPKRHYFTTKHGARLPKEVI